MIVHNIFFTYLVFIFLYELKFGMNEYIILYVYSIVCAYKIYVKNIYNNSRHCQNRRSPEFEKYFPYIGRVWTFSIFIWILYIKETFML